MLFIGVNVCNTVPMGIRRIKKGMSRSLDGRCEQITIYQPAQLHVKCLLPTYLYFRPGPDRQTLLEIVVIKVSLSLQSMNEKDSLGNSLIQPNY